MEQSNSQAEVVVARVQDVPPGTTRKFLLPSGGEPVEAFLVNVDGALHAWVNRCRHVALTMDWVEGRFLDETGAFVVCSTHGALYRPDTGECVSGPPLGRFLIRVPIRIEGDVVLASTPQDL